MSFYAQPMSHEIRDWMREQSGVQLTEQARGVAVRRADLWNGEILGAVAFDLWTKNSCYAHVCVKNNAAGRRLIAEALPYAFRHVDVLLGTTRASNARANVLAKRLGFEITHVTLDGWEKGEALLHWELRRENCRYLKQDGMLARTAPSVIQRILDGL